jgi:hypothetical protein
MAAAAITKKHFALIFLLSFQGTNPNGKARHRQASSSLSRDCHQPLGLKIVRSALRVPEQLYLPEPGS